MINLETLKRERIAKLTEARDIHETAKAEKRELTSTEKCEYNKLIDEVDQLTTNVKTEARKQHKEMGGEGECPDPFYNSAGPRNWNDAKPTVKNPRSYRSLFHKNESKALSKGEFENAGEFFQAIASERFDPRLMELRQHAEGVGALGGFSVPEEFGAWLLDTSLEDEIIRSRATVHMMQSSTKHVPAWDSLDKTGGQLYGGLSATWVAELAPNVSQEARMRSMTLHANKLAIYADVSNELLQDGADFENNLGKAIMGALGYGLDQAFLTGNGAGQPVGVLNDPALITVASTGFPSAAVGDNYVDLVSMYNRLHKAGPGQPVWIVNHEVIPELATLTDAIGNLIWQPNARDSIPNNILGYPVLSTEKLPGLGQPGSIILVNLFHYQVGLRQEIYLDKSNAPGWTQDYSSFRSILRADGQGSWDQPMTRQDGSTVSWCVALG